MKEYLVTFERGAVKIIYIVLAKTAKDAIWQVMDKHYISIPKSMFKATSIASLHNEQGKVLEPIECKWRQKARLKVINKDKIVILILIFVLFIQNICNAPSVKSEKINIKEGDVITVECSAYTADYKSCGKYPDDPNYGITYSGEYVQEGMIAADTNILPINTTVYIKGLGVYVVKDIGEYIVGNRVDIYMEDKNKAIKFGRQERELIILEMGGQVGVLQGL